MIEINKILACVDSSQYSTSVMKYSSYIAKKINATVEALHVIDILQLEGPFMYDLSGALGLEPYSNFSSNIKKMLEEKGKNVLISFEDIAKFYNVNLKTKMSLGIVSSVIIENSKDFDMVFIGKKGINASYERGILGSNIEPVVRKIEKPLFVANEHFYTPRNLIVAYDGSAVSKIALEYANFYHKHFNADINVINVGTKKEKAEELFSELPVNMNKQFIESDKTAASIVDFVSQKDNSLLCIGAYSKNKILEMILGSTTEAILRRNTEFPLLIVR